MEMVMLCKHISIREIEEEFYVFCWKNSSVVMCLTKCCGWKNKFELDDLSLCLLIYGHKHTVIDWNFWLKSK